MDDALESLFHEVRSEVGDDHRPWVTLSYAQSIDGSISTATKQPLALSCPASLKMTHRLRDAHQAILVGIGTVLADDPALTVREVEGTSPQPVVVDSHLRIPVESKLLQGPKPPWIAAALDASTASAERLEKLGARVLRLSSPESERIPLQDLLRSLREMGVKRLMVEGGARIITSFLRERLVDRIVVTITPHLIGGTHAIEDLSGRVISDFPRLEQANATRLDEDWILWGRPSWGRA
jgi:3,4-dihydroxy 2-butanone 4-phosphate synthase/GTP cyclohydrolase II